MTTPNPKSGHPDPDERTNETAMTDLAAENAELRKLLDDANRQLEGCRLEQKYIEKLYGAAFYSSAQLASISELSTGRFLDVNDAWVKTRGFTREEAVGKTAEELNIWGGDRESRRKILEDITQYGQLRDYETQSVMRDGAIRDFILNAEILKVHDQELIFFSGIDITDRKEIERNLQRNQKLDAVGQLSGGIAHDFNNLLGIILGNLELMAESVTPDDKLLPLLSSAIHGAERGVKITRKLLSFSSKHTAGNEITNVTELIDSMKELIAKSVTATITVQTDLADDVWNVNIDPGDFEDAIINLSINAYDAMPDGGTLTIRTRNTVLDAEYVKIHPSVTTGEYVEVKVSDTGSGLSKTIQERIFEPFFTTKERGRGTGLGLSMVFGFIKRSNGHIQVNSKLGKGTCFSIYFPRSHADLKHPQDIEKTTQPLPVGTETILIVDDEVSLANLACQRLENLGYTTHVAYDASRALDILKNNPEIDLLFSDIVMAGSMNGFQLALQARDLRPDLKILLTSGYSRADEFLTTEAKLELGNISDNILGKPYSNGKLATAIRQTLMD